MRPSLADQRWLGGNHDQQLRAELREKVQRGETVHSPARSLSPEEIRAYEAQLLARDRKAPPQPATAPTTPPKPVRTPPPETAEDRADRHPLHDETARCSPIERGREFHAEPAPPAQEIPMPPLEAARALRAELEQIEEQRREKLAALQDLRAELVAEVAELDNALAGFLPAPTPKPVARTRKRRAEALTVRIVDLLADGQQRSVTELATALDAPSELTATTCARLATSGHIRRVARGIYAINR